MEKAYKIFKLLTWLLVFAILIVGAYVLYDRLSGQIRLGGVATAATEETGEPTQPAPDVALQDRDGNQVHLSDFLGKPVILNFWASWCGPCKSEMPDLEAAYQKYGSQIHFLMVNCTDGSRETVETAGEFIDSAGYTFPVYFDTTYEAASTYGASSIPLTYFIDAQGNLMAYYMGAMSAEVLQQGIDMIYTPDTAQ